MAEHTPAPVTVEAIEAHSYGGVAYDIGARYDVAAELVDSILVQGKAKLLSDAPPPPASRAAAPARAAAQPVNRRRPQARPAPSKATPKAKAKAKTKVTKKPARRRK